jgi:outer membrane protein assembly factor BamC
MFMPTISRLSLKRLQAATLAASVVCLSGCTVFSSESGKIDYKSAKPGSTLDVPPDLTRLANDPRYNVGAGGISASQFAGLQGSSNPSNVAPVSMGDVRIERAGSTRWLVVNRDPNALWPVLREFWQENGFVLTQDQSTVGVMETDWAENRAKIPEDMIRRTIGRVLDQLYSTGERDKFRTRLERVGAGGAEIYISHRGMEEVYTSTNKEQTVWQPRAASPELEAEFLRRLMVRLGAQPAAAQQVVAAAPEARPQSRATTLNGQQVVQLDDGFDRAWRRVGLALDRTGFTVEDRDRNNGVYFVRYQTPGTPGSEPGFFAKLFGNSNPTNTPLKYRVSVKAAGTGSVVSVLTAEGAPDASENAQRIVKVLADDLR